MATPVPDHLKHDWSRSKKTTTEEEEEDEDDDLVDKMLKKSGCLKLHHAVQDCMADHRDWRQCQKEVSAFRKCVNDNMAPSRGQGQGKTS